MLVAPTIAVMKTAIFTVGTELAQGELVDTNSAWIAEQCSALGCQIAQMVTLPDDVEAIVATLHRLVREVRLVVVTGGLGPTSDDLTARAAAKAFDQPLVEDRGTVEKIRRLWARRGREMPESNLNQARLPEQAEVLQNPVGTAPGFLLGHDSVDIFFLPGVPREMKALFRQEVLPRIAPRTVRRTHQVHLRSYGMPESELADQLAELEREHEGIIFGYRAHFPEVEIKIAARAEDESAAESIARQVAEQVQARLGEVVYGGRHDSFPGAVGRALRDRGLCLSVAESCTGGLVGAMLTRVAGSSDYLTFDAVTYANSAKSKVLGVPMEVLRAHGAVSAETAGAMAEGALRLDESDLAVSITGIAGPGGGSETKPVGTVWLGLAQKGAPTHTEQHLFHGDREAVRIRAAYTALRLVMRAALGRPLG